MSLGASDNIKILLTTSENKKAKRPHQAFLNLRDTKSDLETSLAFQVKENGKAKIDLVSTECQAQAPGADIIQSQKDIPTQLLASPESLEASLVIASFGSSTPYKSKAFDLSIKLDTTSPQAPQEKPLRYGKLPEIHHIFKSDPTSPPKIITLVFVAAVLVALPALLFSWVSLGANLNHASRAFGRSPIAHALFFLSIVAMEGIFFMYYTSWNLFQTLPGAVGIGLVTFLSGSRALREVQERRLTGLR